MPNYEIVGSYFHPPAKAILSGIPQGTILRLRAEPTNEYDPNAIQVLIRPAENLIPEEDYSALEQELSGFGKDLNDFFSQSEWHLGYIRKEIAKVLRESNIVPLNTEIEVEFLINFSGKPMISLNEI